LFSEHADGYSKTVICDFGFPITDKTPATHAQDRLSVLVEKELSAKPMQNGGREFSQMSLKALRRDVTSRKILSF
jgi:hypothetical protein